MIQLILLAEKVDYAKEYEHLWPIAIGLLAAAMLYAAIATWRVTSKDDPRGHH